MELVVLYHLLGRRQLQDLCYGRNFRAVVDWYHPVDSMEATSNATHSHHTLGAFAYQVMHVHQVPPQGIENDRGGYIPAVSQRS